MPGKGLGHGDARARRTGYRNSAPFPLDVNPERAGVRGRSSRANGGKAITPRMMTIMATDIGRCRKTMALPSPIDTALRNWASASGPRIMPTTTGAVGKS